MIPTASKKHVSRRTFLRGSGVALALPWLDAMLPAFATRAQAAAATAPPKRFVAVNYGLGFQRRICFLHRKERATSRHRT